MRKMLEKLINMFLGNADKLKRLQVKLVQIKVKYNTAIVKKSAAIACFSGLVLGFLVKYWLL